MPEVFDHFFRLLGTSAERASSTSSRSTRPTGCTPIRRRAPRRSTCDRGGMPRPPCSRASSRAPARALDAYLDSAADAYDLSVTRFLYDTYETTAGLRDPALLRRMPQLAPLLTRTLAAHVERRFTDPRLRQILGYPAVFLGGSPVRRAEPVPPDEPPRPRRGRPLPARRLRRGHPRRRAARRRAGRRHRDGRRGRADRDGASAIRGAAAAARRHRHPARGRAPHPRRPRRLGRRPAPHRDGAAARRAADLPREVVGVARRRARARCC